MKKSVRSCIIIAACTAMNIILRYVSYSLELPVWLDMAGTCIASYFTGIWGGIISGVAYNLIFGLINGLTPVYAVTSIFAAMFFSIMIKKGYMNSLSKAAGLSFWSGIICVFISTPLNLLFNSGYTGNPWGDALYDMLEWYNTPRILAALAGEAVVEMIDKQVCVLGSYFLIKLLLRRKNPKPTDSGIKAIALVMAAAVIMPHLMLPASVFAEDEMCSENFVETIYNNTNGIVSSEANDIAETDDGYIWIGSYAGLTRFDGTSFEFIREGGLVSIMSMMTDSKGRLWIGTNAAGIARYEKGRYTYFKTEDGLPVNSVRSFAEDKDGNVYAGTAERLCRINTDDTIDVLPYDLTFVKSMGMYNNILTVIDNNGHLSAVTKGRVISADEAAPEVFFNGLAITSHGITAASDDGRLICFDIAEDSFVKTKEIDISDEGITAVFEDSRRRLWAAVGSDFGFLEADGDFHRMHSNSFDSSIDSFHEDYQGNIWLTSSRYGVMKLSESRFSNLFDKAGIENTVVNTVALYDGCYYFGTDKGVIIADSESLIQKPNALSKLTEGCRVRSLMVDSQNRLWLCTYGDSGLICYDARSGVTCFNTETTDTTGNRFRCVTELSDGTIAAGATEGINFIKDGKLTTKLTASDGLSNTQILCITQVKGENVWAGTDGGGICIIKDGEIIKKITSENGLTSDIILRLVPHEDGILAVTSNSLCHIDHNGRVKALTNFPYFNNYDVIINGTKAYITCSAGIYEAELSDICSNKSGHYKLYSAKDGLISGLTANSWNYISEDGTLYLCSNSGVIVLSPNAKDMGSSVKFDISSIEYNNTKVLPDDNNSCVLPKSTKQISLYAAVRNYALSDIKVRFYAEEIEKNPKTYDWDKVEPIHISGMESSEYTVHFQILDSSCENILEEKTYRLIRETQMWETPWYKTYLIIVCSEILIFATIVIANIINASRKKENLERLREELEDKVRSQTKELLDQHKKTEELFLRTVSALSGAVDAKDRYTSGHSKRVAEYARMIAMRMGKSPEEQNEIYRAGLLHDVGKIRVPVEIINKAGKLTDEEYELIKIHPVTGYHILRNISENSLIAIGAKFHHERYDGKGYPNGLEGRNIPEVARILGVADSYDAMASNRSYRKALPQNVVREEILKGRGTQFDPEIADIMLQMMDEDKDYMLRQTNSLRRKILVVDDDNINIKLICGIMKNEPMYEIIPVESAAEALEILGSNSIDLVLLDIMMPDMDGFEALEMIRKKSSVPVVFMTGDKNLETIQKAAKMGCGDYITKPFQPLLLKEVIHSMAD